MSAWLAATLVALTLCLAAGPVHAQPQTLTPAQRRQLAQADDAFGKAGEAFGGGRFDEAITLLEAVAPVWGELRGPGAAADALANVVAAHEHAGRYVDALSVLRQVVALRMHAVGPMHPRVREEQMHLSLVLEKLGRHEENVTTLRNALAMAEANLPAGHPELLGFRELLWGSLCTLGRYAEAATELEQAVVAAEQSLGAEHPQVGGMLSNLAGTEQELGRFDAAEAKLRRALGIFERLLGPDHPTLTNVLNGVGNLHVRRGEYEQAERIYRRIITIQEAATDADHVDLAAPLQNLATVLEARGDRQGARAARSRALALLLAAHGPAHELVGSAQLAIALEQATDELDTSAALPAAEAALAVLTAALPTANPTLQQARATVAMLYMLGARPDLAEAMQRSALAELQNSLGEQHPYVGAAHHMLGMILDLRGAHGGAEAAYRQALALYEETLPPHHPRLADAARDLAEVMWSVGRLDEAVALQRRANDLREAHLAAIMVTGAERDKRLFVAKYQFETDITLSLHAQGAPQGPAAAALALSTLLQRKGRVLDVMSDTVQAVRQQLSPSDTALLDQLASLRAQLAGESFAGQASTATALEQQADALERQLAERSLAFRLHTRPPTLAEVRSALPEGAALLEIAQYRPYDHDAASFTGQWRLPARYSAYVVRRDGPVGFADLGLASEIDALVEALRRGLARGGEVDGPARALHDRVLGPLSQQLEGVRQLLIAPDGQLHLIPFGVLRDGQGRYLLQTKVLSYLTSGRDLVRLGHPAGPSGAPLLVANPDFGTAGASGGRVRGGQTLSFPPLPGTAREAEVLSAMLRGAEIHTGAAATESALKAARGPRVLHVASHGFFLGRAAGAPPPATRGLSLPGVELREMPPPIDNPLLRSGLALAGANADPAEAGGTRDDGLLTALEAASLDLHGTELVVLSACETGVGQVQGGEGVYGLRRAFIMAGARSLVTSLWKVDDQATQKLMHGYYTALAEGKGRAQSLREAQLALLDDPELAHPYFWASFIAVGDWAPLPDAARSLDVSALQVRPRGCACATAGAPRDPHGGVAAALLVLAIALRHRHSRRARAAACATSVGPGLITRRAVAGSLPATRRA